MPWKDEPESEDVNPLTPSIRILSLTGRIGRLRMISYPIGLSVLLGLLLFVLLSVVEPDSTSALVGLTVNGFVFLVVTGIWTVRRVQDFNGPILVSAIFLITMIFLPIVNLLLCFIPGTKGENRYGEPPPPNGAGVCVLAFLTSGIAIIGILAAIVIPAFHDYRMRAKAGTIQPVIQDGLNLSYWPRDALDQSCQGGSLKTDLSSSLATPADPSAYVSSPVNDISITIVSERIAEVTATYRAIEGVVEDGQTIVFTGTCQGGSMTWKVSGTVPERYPNATFAGLGQ